MKEDMTEEQRECLSLLADVFGGEHNLIGELRSCGKGVRYFTNLSLSTYDTDELTLIVLLAHKRAIRVCIGAGDESRIEITLHKRSHGVEKQYQNHFTIDEAIDRMNKYHKD